MNTTKSPWLAMTRLRRACEYVPAWTNGISGAEGEGDGAGDGNGSGTADTETPREKALREEKDRHFAKAKAAQDELANANKTLKEVQDRLTEIENKDKSDKEKAEAAAAKATKDLEEATAKAVEAASLNEKLQVQIAFLASTKYVWHDPKTALKLVSDFGEIQVKDGAVTGLDKAIDKMAKEQPFLVKSGGDGSGKGGNAGTTGQAGNGASTRANAGTETQQQMEHRLRQQYQIPR